VDVALFVSDGVPMTGDDFVEFLGLLKAGHATQSQWFCRQEVIVTTDVMKEPASSEGIVATRLSYALFIFGVVAGIVLGIEHHRRALQGLIVFPEPAPLWAWVGVGCLYGTLPAALLAFWNPRVAGCALWGLAAILISVSALNRYDFWWLNLLRWSWVTYVLRWMMREPVAQALVGTALWFSRRPGDSE
jgi:hypothetical protein